MKLFLDVTKSHNIKTNADEIFRYMHEFPHKYIQMSLFDINN